MARPPGPGKCVHCLKVPVARNWDHVFPESWYPDATPENLEKWQIPSCIPCNSSYGKIESDFLSRVGLSLDPHDPSSRSVVEKALRSMKPAAGRNERDRRSRAGRGERIISETLHGTQIPDGATIPGMGERWSRPKEEQVAVLLPADSLKRMTEKIVRGLFFVEESRFIEPPYRIDFFVLTEEAAQPMRDALDRFGITYAREPGLIVRRALAAEDQMSSLFEIVFWKQFKTYATVTVPQPTLAK